MTESRRVAYWATDAEGTPADAAPKRNDYAVYHFNVPDGGLVVMQELGRLNVSGVDDFSGTLTGEGLVGVADNAVIDFGDGASPLLYLDRPLALGANVTVNTTAANGRLLLARAQSFIGAENLETWTATVGNREYRFAVSNDGQSLYLVMKTNTILLFK